MKTIIANWKANPATLEEASELFDFSVAEALKHQNIKTIICPPFVYIEELAKISRQYLGAQDVFWSESGPYTGEISTDMLKNLGVSYALIGHSDRRYKIGESDEMINKKIKAALEANIIPILLIGEQNRGDDRTKVLEKQLVADLNDLTGEQIARVLITYEPVWAISTEPGASPSTTFGTKVVLGKPDTPENVLEAIKTIDEFLSTRYSLPTTHYLYGGSVNQNNVADFLKYSEISGAVIGGASLRREEFAEILKIVDNIK